MISSKGVKNACFYAACAVVFLGCSGVGDVSTPTSGPQARGRSEPTELDLDEVLGTIPSTSTTVATTTSVQPTTTTVSTTTVVVVSSTSETTVQVTTTAVPDTVPARDDHPLTVDTEAPTTTVAPTTEPIYESTSVWDQLAECESGGDWHINTGNGYYGGVQFSKESWDGVGGNGYPHENSREEQIHRAELLLDMQGWSAWPACSRKLGLR